jgi:hypothetical protein
MSKPRVMTVEEAREEFLIKMWHNIEYWHTTKVVDLEPGQTETLWRLEGLMHSTLAVLDGNTCIPGMDVIPRVPRADIKYLREKEKIGFHEKTWQGNWHTTYTELLKNLGSVERN